MKKAIGILIITIWAIGIGTVWMTDYSTRPGSTANSPENLPSGIVGENSTGLPTILVFCIRSVLAVGLL